MADDLTKESLNKSLALLEIIKEALEGKGFEIEGVEVKEHKKSFAVMKKGEPVAWMPVYTRTFHLTIKENDSFPKKKDDPCERPITVHIGNISAREIIKVGERKDEGVS